MVIKNYSVNTAIESVKELMLTLSKLHVGNALAT